MKPLGWIFLVASLSFVWGLMIWSYVKVFAAPREIEKPPDMLGG